MRIGALTPFCLAGLLLVAACAPRPQAGAPTPDAPVDLRSPDSETVRPASRPGSTGARALGATGVSADALDSITPGERAAALGGSGGTELGETLASLGAAGEPGLWLRTGLVSEVTQGRVELPDGSGSLQVELRPSGREAGSGSQMSLSAFRSLDLPLTQLVTLRVLRGG